jgi:hypothetical protein
MNLPGFTAEASLHQIRESYHVAENNIGSVVNNDIVP